MKYIQFRVMTVPVAICWAALLPVAQSAPQPIVSPRPLVDASDQLQQLYGKVVTYEEPILVWQGEVEGDPKVKGGLAPRSRRLVMPAETGKDPDVDAVIGKVLQSYSTQNVGTRFEMRKTSWGYHIVPTQSYDRNGNLVPAKSLLDSVVQVAPEERTPRQHLLAVLDAVSAATAVRIGIGGQGDPGGFDRLFRPATPSFTWGSDGKSGRDALIDLFGRSATTLSWRLLCQAGTSAEGGDCVFNLSLLEVAVSDPSGKPAKRILRYDRCGDCPQLGPPPE
jgi:hypothetical protein